MSGWRLYDVLEDVECPDCNGVLKRKTSQRGVFFGCSDYPECKHSVDAVIMLEAVLSRVIGRVESLERQTLSLRQSRDWLRDAGHDV